MFIVAVMFSTLRQLEHWLHQHIFKVGWLLTRDFKITTILYYTFFLPGVLLYEFTYWLAAGILNVRAERAIAWPEQQEIGELRLNFVKLSRKAPDYKIALINLAPLLMGLAVIWLVTRYILQVDDIIASVDRITLQNLQGLLSQLTNTPDFWFWFYLLFTVSNAMLPDMRQIRYWSWLLPAIASVGILLFALGAAEAVLADALNGPIAEIIVTLSGLLAVIIAVDLVAVALLGVIESVIERVTGHSATFRNGKMVFMTRAEMIEQRKQAVQKERAARKRQQVQSQILQSVYDLDLPVPGAPGEVPITQVLTSVIEVTEPKDVEKPSRPQRQIPSMISVEAEKVSEIEEQKQKSDEDTISYEDFEDPA